MTAYPLLDDLAAHFSAVGVGFRRSADGSELQVELADTDHLLYFTETIGELHCFVPLTDPLPAGVDEGAILVALARRSPIPGNYRPVASYILDVRREAGLYLSLPMPATFSATGLDDLIALAMATIETTATGA